MKALFYNNKHNPTMKQRQKLAKKWSLDMTTVDKYIYRLRKRPAEMEAKKFAKKVQQKIEDNCCKKKLTTPGQNVSIN